MIDLDALLSGFNLLFGDFTPWLIVIPGILLGLLFGAVQEVSL